MFTKQHTDVRPTEISGQKCLATVKLIERLKDATEDRLTDEELSKVAERNTRPGGDGYTNLATAIKYCERNFGVTWEREIGAGCIVKCNSERLRSKAGKARRHIGRTAKRSVIQLRCVDVAAMEDGDRSDHLVELAQLGTLAVMADNRTTKKLKARDIRDPAELGRLLENWKTGTNG